MTPPPPDDIGLFRLDEGWCKRMEPMLPALSLRVAFSLGGEPLKDGDWIVSSERMVNAGASADRPFFTVNCGLLLGLLDLTLEVTGHPDYARGRYAPPPRRPPPEVVHRYVDYARPDGLSSMPEMQVWPSSREQGRAAATLFISGLTFLVLHEQAHFHNGHSAYQLEVLGIPCWMKATGSGSGLDSTTARALEWEADITAINTLLSVVPESGAAEPLTQEWLGGHERALVDAFVGAGVTMALLSCVDRTLKDPAERRHPSPAARLVTLLNSLEEFFKSCGVWREEYEQHLQTAETELHAVYSAAGCLHDFDLAVASRQADGPADYVLDPVARERAEFAPRRMELDEKLATLRAAIDFRLGIRDRQTGDDLS